MSEKILLTGARSAIALEVARSLRRAGHTVFVAETFPRYVTAFSNCVEASFEVPPPRFEPELFINRLLDLVQQHRISHLIPTGEEILYVARGRDRLRAVCNVFCDTSEQLQRLHHKHRFQKMASQIGPAPQTWAVESSSQLQQLQERHRPLVLKAVYSRFGQRVRMLEGPPIESLPRGTWIGQEYLRGREVCSLGIARTGRLLAHVAYLPRFRLPLGPSFCFEPCSEPQVEAWVRTFVERHHVTGSIAFDFIVTEAGTPYPLECNPRLTSGVHLFPNGVLPATLLGDHATFAESGGPAMWGLAMLGIALPRVRSKTELCEWLKMFRASRDVFWDAQDPRPAFNVLSSQPHLRELSRKHQLTLGEATTFYTEWNGD